MFVSRCIALAFVGVCGAIHIRHGTRAKIQDFAPFTPSSPTVTHLIKDPIGALGSDSMGPLAQAMAGPQVDDAISKQLEMINKNPFDAGSASKGNDDLKEVHGKIKRYLGKLNALYAIAAPSTDTPQAKQEESANVTNASNDEPEEKEDNGPELKLPQLRKAVLTAAIKKAASSALQAADSKMQQERAAEEARHTAAVQNLTAVALKEKASTLTAKWRVQQALKAKKQAREALTKLQTHEMKTQMAINTLSEHDSTVKADIQDATKELGNVQNNLKERIQAFREQQKVFKRAQDALLEEKASQIQEMFERQAAGGAGNQDASLDSQSMERFLSARK